MAQAIFTDIDLFKNEIQNSILDKAVVKNASTLTGVGGEAGQIIFLDTDTPQHKAGFYFYSGNQWNLIPNAVDVERIIENSVKGLSPKGSVDFTSWTNVTLTSSENKVFLDQDGKESDKGEIELETWVFNIEELTIDQKIDINKTLEARFNYDQDNTEDNPFNEVGVLVNNKITNNYNIDCPEPLTSLVAGKTKLLLKDQTKKSENGLYDVRKAEEVPVSENDEPVVNKLQVTVTRCSNLSKDRLVDGTTTGKAKDPDSAVNAYVFVQRGQEHVHQDVAFVQTRESLNGDDAKVGDDLEFVQFSGASGGVQAQGSAKVVNGNTVTVITKRSEDASNAVSLLTTSEHMEVTSDKITRLISPQSITATSSITGITAAINSAITNYVNTFKSTLDPSNELVITAENFKSVSVEFSHNNSPATIPHKLNTDWFVQVILNEHMTKENPTVDAKVVFQFVGNPYSVIPESWKVSDKQN